MRLVLFTFICCGPLSAPVAVASFLPARSRIVSGRGNLQRQRRQEILTMLASPDDFLPEVSAATAGQPLVRQAAI